MCDTTAVLPVPGGAMPKTSWGPLKSLGTSSEVVSWLQNCINHELLDLERLKDRGPVLLREAT